MSAIFVPESIRRLAIDPVRKIPVPWFVAWVDGRPEFRCADGDKFVRAVRERRCWVCGDPLEGRATYVIGPMCAVNRLTSEPPCHPACAEYSARTCPFLCRPRMDRRVGGLPEEATSAGIMIRRNPGVSCLWEGRVPGATPFRDGSGGVLFRLHYPIAVSWWTEGRAATRAEVDASVASGLPALKGLARARGPEARLMLADQIRASEPFFAMACGVIDPRDRGADDDGR